MAGVQESRRAKNRAAAVRLFIYLFEYTEDNAQIEPTKPKNELRCDVADRRRQKKLFEIRRIIEPLNAICTVSQHYAPNASEPQ